MEINRPSQQVLGKQGTNCETEPLPPTPVSRQQYVSVEKLLQRVNQQPYESLSFISTHDLSLMLHNT